MEIPLTEHPPYGKADGSNSKDRATCFLTS